MFATGTLRNRVRAVSERALASGALRPIPTDFRVLADGEVPFLVRIVSKLASKHQEFQRDRPAGSNPFLPYDPELHVADVSPTHVGLLNKFNVVEDHLLIVTREFQHQQTRLNADDFLALARCLAEYPSLGFYNSGQVAGASQSHKHLQLIPLPLSGEFPQLPLTPFDPFDAQSAGEPTGTHRRRLPFAHAAIGLRELREGDTQGAAVDLEAGYRRLLARLQIPLPEDRETRIPAAYNLLITREWMLAVPRRHECFAGISLNAMAFAGALLVRDSRQLESLKEAGPMTALKRAAGAVCE